MWVKNLRSDYDLHTESDTNLTIWAACAKDELATETVFSNELKGQLPTWMGFYKLDRLNNEAIGPPNK